jgi:ATP-dependent DNA helicase RecG
MERALKRLERVLELEKQQGYQNKAVVGGIRQFAVFWVSQAREAATDEADLALAEQIGQVLMDYNRLPGVEARARAIESLLEHVERRKSRLPVEPAAPPVVKPGAPPSPPIPAPQQAETSSEEAGRESLSAVETAEAGEEEEAAEAIEEPAEPEAEPDTPQVPPDPAGLSRPVTSLKGVGQKIAEKLSRLGAETIWELLYLFPRRYDDYTLLKPINRLKYGEQVTVIGTIWQTKARRSRTNQPVTECIINDGTGSIQATWFNQPWLADQLPAGMQIVLSG